jgi:hypothetical protein
MHIKIIIVYLLLCVYSFALIKPLMPVIKDVLAHTFYNLEHMATVHYENGKYHIHTELSAEHDNSEKKNNTDSMYETLAQHVPLTNQNINFQITELTEDMYPSTFTFILTGFIRLNSPPPRLLRIS